MNATTDRDDATPAKLWGFLFLLVPIFVGGGLVFAPQSWWLPASASTVAPKIDFLFNVIVVVTGVTFVLTNLLLAYTIFFTRRSGKAMYTHGNHQLEIIWSIIPGILLVILAFWQRGTWAEIKQSVPEKADVEMRVIAKQFAWSGVYPGRDGKLDTDDDVEVEQQLIVPKGKTVLVHLVSRDVLHSFFLPHLRIKQDAVPGMVIPVWFTPTETTHDYATKHGMYERLLDNLEGRSPKPFTESQRAVLLDLVSTPEPAAPKAAVKEARQRYQEKEEQAKRAFGDDRLFEQLKAGKLGQRLAGLNQIHNWTYEIACAELCGAEHWYMKGNVLVVEPEEFDAWLGERSR